MNIVYASDNKFAEILGISIISLFENNKNCEEISVFILDDKINEENKNRLLLIGKKYVRSVSFIDVSVLDVPNSVQSARWSKSAFTRLFMRRILPIEIKKILYLDCDILIMDSISDLYDTDVSNCKVAVVQDCISRYYRENIDLKADDIYCNSGVLLIDLDKWDEEEFMAFFDDHSNTIKYPDQDIINGVCSSQMLILDCRYNLYTALYDFSYKDLLNYRKPSNFYSEAEVEKAKSDPAIIHFTTSFLSLRPWIEGCQHPYVAEWLKYKAMSPWAEVPLRKDNRSGKKKFAVKIYKALPKDLAVGIAGLLHSKIVPMMRRKKHRNG